jgi:hypothetical protein
MQLPPLEVMLSWPVGNYAHPSEVRGPAIHILTYIFVPLLTVLVLLRAYTRLRLTKNFGADDVAIVAALVPTLACAVLSMLAVQYHGWDRHVWDVPTDQLIITLKFELAIETLFSLACVLTRISILLLIIRLMSTGSRALKRMAIAAIVLMCLEEIVFTIVAINTCK